jgi:hypothetical protein
MDEVRASLQLATQVANEKSRQMISAQATFQGSPRELLQGNAGGVANAVIGAAPGGPWAAIFAGIMKLLQGTQGFAKALESSETVFKSVAAALDQFLQPITNIIPLLTRIGVFVGDLFKAFQGLANALNLTLPVVDFVVDVLLEIVDALAKIFNSLINVFVRILRKLNMDKAADKLASQQLSLDAVTSAADLAATALDNAGRAIGEFTGILNAPTGFKYALAKYGAIDAGGTTGLSSNAYTAGSAYSLGGMGPGSTTNNTTIQFGDTTIAQPVDVGQIIADFQSRLDFAMRATAGANAGSNNGWAASSAVPVATSPNRHDTARAGLTTMKGT